MDVLEMDRASTQPVEPAAPRTATVLAFLAAFAVTASWLCIYGLTNALVTADLMAPWPRDADPRPRWMLNVFTGLFLASAGIGLLFRWMSRRQLRRIDAMADAE